MRLTAAITPEDGGFVAQCLEVDVASQGDTVEDAIANLREALELYFEDAPGPVRASPVIIVLSSIAACDAAPPGSDAGAPAESDGGVLI